MHRSLQELEDGVARFGEASSRAGALRMIVRRPAVDEREVLDEVTFDVDAGVVGDTWASRSSRSRPDGSPDPRAQVTLVEARVAELIAGDTERWQLFGDQLFVELDLSEDALPPGTRLVVGDAVLEISDKPHTGCAKFAARFGADALRLVMSPDGQRRRLRGANARVIRGGTARTGDVVRVERKGAPPLVPIETERLRLRSFARDLSDVDALHAIQSDPEHMRYYPHPFSRDETVAWIERWLRHEDEHGFALWAIEDRETGEFLGNCGPTYQRVDGTDELEIGWSVTPRRANQGIATEVATAVRDVCLGTLGQPYVIALVRPENVPSSRVAEKIGMTVWKDTEHGADSWLHRVYRIDRPTG